MKPPLPALCLALAAVCALSDAVASSTVAATSAAAASAPASAPVRATRAASAACARLGASGPQRGHGVTSKVRHIPDESDPCADSTGVAPALPR